MSCKTNDSLSTNIKWNESKTLWKIWRKSFAPSQSKSKIIASTTNRTKTCKGFVDNFKQNYTDSIDHVLLQISKYDQWVHSKRTSSVTRWFCFQIWAKLYMAMSIFYYNMNLLSNMSHMYIAMQHLMMCTYSWWYIVVEKRKKKVMLRIVIIYWLNKFCMVEVITCFHYEFF